MSFVNIKELIQKEPILGSIDLNLCVSCKAVKKLCKLNYCPLIHALDLYPKIDNKIETIDNDNFFGPSMQIFVGSTSYPKVFTGPLTMISPDKFKPEITANPSQWVNLSAKEIIALRFNLLRTKQEAHVKFTINNINQRIQDKLEQISLSVKEVEVESKLAGKPVINMDLNPETQPLGPSSLIKRFDITSNPKIPNKVDSIINDELKAVEQLDMLYRNNYDVYYLQNILSSGAMGKEKNRKITPTKWSITAVDDTLGKKLIQEIRTKPYVTNIEIKQGNLFGNYFTVILLPGIFRFENIEAWLPGNIFTIGRAKHIFTIDREGFDEKELIKGKHGYSKQAGGYYASRLALLEYLHKIGRQASVLVIREITPEYSVPLGVWVVREAMRKTMKAQSIKFMNHAEITNWLRDKLHGNALLYLNKSILFTQTSIDDFF